MTRGEKFKEVFGLTFKEFCNINEDCDGEFLNNPFKKVYAYTVRIKGYAVDYSGRQIKGCETLATSKTAAVMECKENLRSWERGCLFEVEEGWDLDE